MSFLNPKSSTTIQSYLQMIDRYTLGIVGRGYVSLKNYYEFLGATNSGDIHQVLIDAMDGICPTGHRFNSSICYPKGLLVLRESLTLNAEKL